MIGREAFNRPWFLRHADARLFGTRDPNLSRREVVETYLEQTEAAHADGMPSPPWGQEEELGYDVLQPLLTLFVGPNPEH